MKEALPPIQFKNPDVQFVLLKNRKPSPFLDVFLGKFWGVWFSGASDSRAFAGDGRSVRLDAESKSSEQILSELASVAGIPE